MSEQSRRYTDREVALVLRRATEIDEAAGPTADPGGGLSLDDLKHIAREVGISPASIERAVATLDRSERLASRFGGAPSVRKAAHVVPTALDRDGVAALVSTVDDEADGTGAVTEALGSVRWTARDRFKSTRVSITARDGETAIEVVEKAEPRLRRIFNLLPAAWGPMLAAPWIASAAGDPLTMIGVGVGAALAGIVAGRAAWAVVSAASDRRVKRLAGTLADEASRLGS
jgi:hypothetical protein